MRKAVLDTDTLSYVLDRRYPEVDATARQYERVFRFFTVTTITVSEVVAGYVQAQDYGELERFLQRTRGFEVLELGEAEAVLAGRILGGLRRAGTPIGLLDPFIAAIAIENGLPLVTNNEAHYRRIVDIGFSLEVQNWRAPADGDKT